MTAKQVQIGDRPCRIYGADCAEYLLLQMTDEHELQRMDNEVAAIAQGAAHPFLFAAVPVESWNDELSPWKAPAVWGKQGFGGNAADTLRFLTEPFIPTLKQQFRLPEDIKIILGGYSLAGLFALWASTQTDLFYGIAAASPSVWFQGWMEFEQQRSIQTQHIYLSLGDKEEHTKNAVMAVVGDNIRTLHSQLIACGADCTFEWNSGGHFKEAALRTARAFQWANDIPEMDDAACRRLKRCRRIYHQAVGKGLPQRCVCHHSICNEIPRNGTVGCTEGWKSGILQSPLIILNERDCATSL